MMLNPFELTDQITGLGCCEVKIFSAEKLTWCFKSTTAFQSEHPA